MHEKIMNFSNNKFYEGALEAHESVENHKIKNMIDVESLSKMDDLTQKSLSPQPPVVFLDTMNVEAPEMSPEGSTSKKNQKDSQIVKSLVETLLDLGVTHRNIAVISPYDDQVDLINRKIGLENLEVDTVDGFQGREKEIVIISLVRSNENNNIGFLKDVRRLNVALTRARKKLIIIGDSSTLDSHETYLSLLDYISKAGKTIRI